LIVEIVTLALVGDEIIELVRNVGFLFFYVQNVSVDVNGRKTAMKAFL